MNKRILPGSVLGVSMVILLLAGLACGGKAEGLRQLASQQLEVAAEKLAGNESSEQEKDVEPTTDTTSKAAPTLKPTGVLLNEIGPNPYGMDENPSGPRRGGVRR